MANDISVADSFNEKSRQIDQALKFTNGDLEKAKLMVAGQYNDAVAIKGKFSSDKAEAYGIFYIFANTAFKSVLNLNALLLPDNSVVSKARIFNNWRTFYAEFGDYVQKEGRSALPAYDFIRHLTDSLNNYDIYADVEYNNLEILTDKLTDIIKKFYSAQDVLCQIEVEITNSMALDSAGIQMELPGAGDGDMMDEAGSIDAKRMAEVESGADYIVDGRVIISPIRGIDINDLKSGDKIKVLLTGSDERTSLIGKKLNAISEEGEKLPITVRVKEKIALEQGGYCIYGLAAKNVLVRIIEEESVKIETGLSQNLPKIDKKSGESKMMIYLSLLIGIIIILLIALLAIL